MIRYNRTAFLKFDTENNGNAFARGPVTVLLAGTPNLAPLFSDSAGTIQKDNPVQTDDTGQYFFYIADGNYDIVINKGRIGEKSILDESIFEVPAVPIAPVLPLNDKVINVLSDLPDPIDGVITLEDNLVYIFGANINIGTDRIGVGRNNVITSNNAADPLLTYTGSGTMFTGIDKTVTFRNIFLDCPSAQVFSFSATTLGFIFFIDTVVIKSCTKFATFDDLSTLDIINTGIISAEDGITVLGNTNWNVFSIVKLSFRTTSATFIGIDFGTSLHITLELNDFIVTGVPGTIGLKGEANSANLKVNSLGTVTTGEFIGGITPLSGITLTDIRWRFNLNSGLSDSKVSAIVSIENNATETVIGTVDTPVKMVGVWLAESLSNFVADGTGRLTYKGERNEILSIDSVLTLLMAAGGADKQVSGFIAINGSVITTTKRQGTASVSKAAPLGMIWEHVFVIDDFVELFVEGNTDTTNIIGVDGILRIH